MTFAYKLSLISTIFPKRPILSLFYRARRCKCREAFKIIFQLFLPILSSKFNFIISCDFLKVSWQAQHFIKFRMVVGDFRNNEKKDPSRIDLNLWHLVQRHDNLTSLFFDFRVLISIFSLKFLQFLLMQHWNGNN